MLVVDGFVRAQQQYRAETLSESYATRGVVRLRKRWLKPVTKHRPSLQERKAW